MSCCTSSSGCSCGVKNCPSLYVGWLPRIGFGLVLVGFGVNHYRNFEGFKNMAAGVYPTVPVVAAIAGMLAYIVPLLMIVGGVLFAIRKLGCISKTCIVAALSGILGWAGLALALNAGADSALLGQAVQGAAILLILYYIIKKMTCCGHGSCAPSSPSSTMSQ